MVKTVVRRTHIFPNLTIHGKQHNRHLRHQPNIQGGRLSLSVKILVEWRCVLLGWGLRLCPPKKKPEEDTQVETPLWCCAWWTSLGGKCTCPELRICPKSHSSSICHTSVDVTTQNVNVRKSTHLQEERNRTHQTIVRNVHLSHQCKTSLLPLKG